MRQAQRSSSPTCPLGRVPLAALALATALMMQGSTAHAAEAHWERLVESRRFDNPYSETLPQPSYRYSHSAVVYKHEVVVSLGYFYNRFSSPTWPAWLRDTWSFSMDDQKWRMLNSGRHGRCPLPRMGHGAAVHGNSMYLYGGTRHDSDAAKRTEENCVASFHGDMWRMRLDQFKRVWEKVDYGEQAVPSARTEVVFEAIGEDGMVLYGGLRRNDTWLYKPPENSWRLVERPLGGSPSQHPGDRYGAASATVGSQLYVFGGACHNCPHKCMQDLWRLDVSAPAPTWAALVHCDALVGDVRGKSTNNGRAHPTGRYYSAMASLLVGAAKEQKLALSHGCDCTVGACRCYSDSWLFDVRTAQWSLVPVSQGGQDVPVPSGDRGGGPSFVGRLPVGRYRHSVVPWRGKLVLFGGESYGPYAYYNDVSVLHGL